MTKQKHLDAQILLSSSKHTEPLEKMPSMGIEGAEVLGGKKVKTHEGKKVTFKRCNILNT